MEPERRLSASAAEPSGSELAGVSPERSSLCSLLPVLSDVQTLVERSNIINRTPHTDLNWYLRFSPDEPEIRLARTVQRVLACRYQPAQLDLIAMAEQVREAEELQCCVQDQVGAMKSTMAARACRPESSMRIEGQWGAALLDASATAHVKATQLRQVREYHRQLEGIRAFLQALRAEKDEANLNVLGSSALQTDRLRTQLQTMLDKNGMVEEILCLSSQLSLHLSHSESCGALLAQLGDVQEEWRLLLGSIRRAFWHASNSACQHAVIIRNIEEVKAKLGARQKLDTFDELCLRAELKLHSQRCLRLQARLDSLALFSLGQKEKDEISRGLLDLKSLIDVAQSEPGANAQECHGALSAQTYRRLQEWITWAKRAQNHIAVRQKLALFPEEARVQMAEMRRFQTDFCSRRSKLRVETDRMKGTCVENKELLQVLETTEGLYESVDQSLECSLDIMKNNLEDREKLFFRLADTDAWLAEILAGRDPHTHADSFSKADISELESELKSHKSSTVDLENRLKLLESVMDGCREASPELSPGESRYLVNRLSGLWTVLDGLLAHEKASSWELEELIFRRRSSEEELSNVQTSLQQISVALTQGGFPLSQETVVTLGQLMHTLVERQWEVQELQHCQEAKRSSLLCTIGELQDRCKALSVNAFEQDKYLHLRNQMEESAAIAREQIQRVKASTLGVGERLRLCLTLLVELPLVKTQCQEAVDQLEAIAEDLSSSELQSERQTIIQTVETLVSWEHSLTEDVKYLEKKLLRGLHFSSELPAFIRLLETMRSELRGAEPVKPDEKALDAKLQRCWVIWRNVECGVRVLEGLGQKEKLDMKNYKDLRSLEDAAKQECQLRMESLSQARESLKDYHWAAQGAISFLHNAEATFLTAPGGFLDCREEQKQTQQALEALEEGFQAHISHLSELLPQLSCLSRPETEELHINILGQLTVGRAVLEAQAQIRLESLQRCEMRQQGHKKCHEDLGQLLWGLQTKLSECTAEKSTSCETCAAQQETAQLLMEDLRKATTRIEELRAGCPMQGCAVGKGGEPGALWRRWLCLRRSLGLLTERTQQRAEEWSDITASMKEACSRLHELQADVPDSSSVNFATADPQELLAQAEMHQATLEEQQQALASLEHRVESVLISSAAQEPLSPGPVGETLVKIRESVGSLRERNRLVLAAAQAEERRRQEGREDMGQVEQWVGATLPSSGNPLQHQELGQDLSSQEAKLEALTEGAQRSHPEIPAGVSSRLEDGHLSMQTEEERLLKKRDPAWTLDSQVAELESSLEKVKVLLEEQSPTVQEAQHLLKNVWDKLDAWHSRLMLLENEVQDVAEDHPDQAYILMDQLTQPLRLYQNAAQMAEQRTAFLGKIPTCLQEFDGVVYSATCWLDEARSWLNAPCCFTTAENLQNHANSLQLVLDDSERIRHVLQDFRAVLDEISTVCDMSFQEDRLEQSDQIVHKMQRTILEQLEHFLQAARAVEAMEEELKAIESNAPELQAVFSNLNLHNQQAILANMASIRRTLEEVESRKGELHLPRGAEESLLIFPRAALLLQMLQEVEQRIEQQAAEGLLKHQQPGPPAGSDEDEEDGSGHSSSSDTLTCSTPEDLEEKPHSSSQREDSDELLPLSEDKILDGGDLFTEMEMSVNVSASVPNADKVETASVMVVPEVHGSVKDLTFRGIQTPHLQAAARQEEGEVHLSPSADARQDQVIGNAERRSQHGQEVDSKNTGSSLEAASLTGCEGDNERLSWNQLYLRICQKMATLGQTKEQRQTPFSSEDGERCIQVPTWTLGSPRSACVALRRAQESVAMFRQIRRVDGLHPDLNEEMYRAARNVLLCLSELMDSGVNPCDGRNDDSQLRQLQQECFATELMTLSELLAAVESEMVPGLSREHSEAECCVKTLRECLDALQLTSTPLCCQLTQQLDLPCKHQELKNLLHICDVFEPKQCGIFLNLMDTPILELILGRRVQERPGDEARLQRASRSLLQGLSLLLEQGEGCLTEGPGRVHSRSRAEAALRRQQKLLQLLRSQVAFIQYLFQREPKALVSLEVEWTQLGVRARCLQQKVLDQEVLSHQRIQEWTRWEENYSRLNRTVDEAEAFLNDGGTGGDDEKLTEWRLEACEQTLVKLGEGRAAAGLLLDQLRGLQVEPGFAATVAPLGGALELRWQSVCRQTEQETRRCRGRRDSMSRSHAVVSSVTNWLAGANNLLKTWSDRISVSDVSQECVHNHLIKLLDFFMETEAVAVTLASLSAADWLRARVTELEVGRGQVSSGLSELQERLQQRLLAAWPPATLLPGLQLWLQQLEDRLIREKESVAGAKNAAQLAGALQSCQGLKVAVANAQILLGFLCQTGPQLVGEDAAALCSQNTLFAEKVGDLRLRCQLLLTDLGTQMDEVEQLRGECAKREERLRRLRAWTEEQKHRLSQRNRPVSQTQAQQSLLELEEVAVRARQVSAAVRALDVTLGQTQHHPCDVSFSAQAEAVRHVCEDLSEMDILRPALQQAVELWSRFGRDLREVSLLTTRLQCSLRNQPLFSLRQTEGHLDFLQLLEEESRKVEELWVSVGTSYQRLEHAVDCGTAQLLQDQMEEELKRWRDVVQELKAEQTKTEETLSLWKAYQRLSDRCSLLLQNLRPQWEDLCRTPPEPDPRHTLHAVQKLQEAAEGLQSMMEDVHAASEPLIARLEAVAANLVKLELHHLSWDVLLLGQATSRKKERLKFLPELSAAFVPLADVSHGRLRAPLCSVGRERAHLLCRQWAESMMHMSERSRVSQAELLHPQSFPEKCQHLESVQKRLQEELNSLKSQHCEGLQDMLTVHQGLQAQIMTGQQRLQALLCQAVHSSQEATEQEKSELVAQAMGMKRSWFTSVAEVVQLRSVTEGQLSRWSVYRGGLQLILDLLGDIDCVLPPAGPLADFNLSSSTDDYQCVLDALVGHSAMYSQTLEAGRQFYETTTDSEHQTRLQTELQDLEKAWDKTQSGLERRCELVNTGVQKWSRCQDTITSLMSELEELETALKQPGSGPSCEEEKRVQESELALQRLASGLRELTTMKTDLAQYVAAGDSALLEQQLEQLHGQWEELCTKVSLRRQEIADRLSAWTIFSDKNKEFCDWLTQMENKVCHRGDLSIEEMVEKLKKDCMEEVNLFSENKSHLKQLGEQLLLASDAAKQTQVSGSLLEVNQRWHNLFHHIEARVKKLKETLATVQQLDKNMSNLRWWLSGMEAELSRPITYSVCHQQEIQRRLAEQQELQRDIQQHTEGVESVLGLCDVLLRDGDAAGSAELEGDSVQETSRSLDQRWRTICALALDRRLRIEETWRLWCKFLDDYSQFEDWLKMAERTAANPNSADVLYTVAKEELKKFEGLQRQVHERLTHLELVNNQYRRLARENRTDRASQLKAMVHEGNRRWDTLHRRVAAIVRRLKYFTSQREEFEGTRDSMLVWLTELDLQLTNVEHFSESDVHHKIQQLNSFRKEIALNTERIDGLIVFGEGLIQRSSPQDAALIEDQLEELHTYCQEVFSRLVRFHQRLSQPPLTVEEPELSSLELICRPRLGRSFASLPATPTHLLASPLERSGRETPLSVDSLPLEWDHTGDVGGSSSHEEEEEEEEDEEEERPYFSALSASSTSVTMHDPPTWPPQRLDSEECAESSPTLTSTPHKQDGLGLMCERSSSSSVEDVQRYSLVLNGDGEQPEEVGVTGLTYPDQSGVIGCRELLQAQSDSQEPPRLESDLDDITSWLQSTVPTLERMQQTERAGGVEDLRAEAKDLREMQKMFARHEPLVLRVNRLTGEAPELQGGLGAVNRAWSRACAFLQQWDASLRKTLANCQEFHESLHSLLLWLDQAERRCHAVSISQPDRSPSALQEHRNTLQDLREELQQRQARHTSLQLLWSHLQPEEAPEDSRETQEKIRVTGSKLKLLLKQVEGDLGALQQRLDRTPSSDQRSCADASPEVPELRKVSSERKSDPAPPHPLLSRLSRAALPLYLLLLLLLLLLPCLIPVSVSNPGCTGTNNFARSFHPMLRYTNGPPPT